MQADNISLQDLTKRVRVGDPCASHDLQCVLTTQLVRIVRQVLRTRRLASWLDRCILETWDALGGTAHLSAHAQQTLIEGVAVHVSAAVVRRLADSQGRAGQETVRS